MLLLCGAATASESGSEQDPEPWTDRVDLSGLFYLTYENGELDDERFAEFFVTRAYLTAETEILPFLDGRLTFDTSQDLEGQGRGDMEVRLKYAFAKFRFKDRGLLNDPNLEAGIVHMVWLDFEEHVNLYRMRGPMFMERSGIFNSADFGVTYASSLGPDMDEAFRSLAGNKYGTRNGSLALGIYNGSGYHGDERNVDKTLEGRITWRPLPDRLKGFQIAGLVIYGDGNQPEEGGDPPEWRTYNGFVSYQAVRATMTAQYVRGRGNQRGTWVETDDPSDAIPYSGYSAFVEGKLGSRKQWRLIGNYDWFERVSDADEDESFRYASASVGYDFGRRNILMLDLDQRWWRAPSRPDDRRVQLVMQLVF